MTTSRLTSRLLCLEMMVDKMTHDNEAIEGALRQIHSDKQTTEELRARIHELEESVARADNVHQFFEQRQQRTIPPEISSGSAPGTNVSHILNMARQVVSADELGSETKPKKDSKKGLASAPAEASASTASSSSLSVALKARTFLEQERNALQHHQRTSLRSKLARLENLKAKLKAQHEQHRRNDAVPLRRFLSYQFPPLFQALFPDNSEVAEDVFDGDADALCNGIDDAIASFAPCVIEHIEHAKEAATQSDDPFELQSLITRFDPEASSVFADAAFLSTLLDLLCRQKEEESEGEFARDACGGDLGPTNLLEHLEHVQSVSNFDSVWLSDNKPSQRNVVVSRNCELVPSLLLPPAKHIPTRRYTYACEEELRDVIELACDIVSTRLKNDLIELQLDTACANRGSRHSSPTAPNFLHELVTLSSASNSSWPAVLKSGAPSFA